MSRCNLLSGDVILYLLDFGSWEVMQSAAGGDFSRWLKMDENTIGFLWKQTH